MATVTPPSVALAAALLSHAAQQYAWTPLPASFPPGPRHDLALDLALQHDPLLSFLRLKSTYGPAVGFKLASRPVILLTSPKLTKEVLVTKSKIFVKAGTAFFPGSSLTGNGLLVSDGELWLRQRRLCNPAFRKCMVDASAQTMVDQTIQFVEEKWQPKRCIRDVYADFNHLTMQIVAKTLFGGALRSHTFDEVGQAITSAFHLFTRRATSMFIVPEWFPTPENVEFNMAVEKLDSVIYSIIQERRAMLAAGNAFIQFPDLLTQLLQATDADHSTMNDQHLRDELMTMLVAGQETSAILLAWCLQTLALHPNLQELMFMEIERVIGKRNPTYVDMANLRFVEAIVLETMRLMPPAYLIGRCANSRTSLGQWEVPKGTSVIIGIYLLHQDPLYWTRPLEFNPSRWLEGEDTRKYWENPSYLPFGGGPRTCIGMGFAMMEVCLVLCIIIQRFKVSLPKGVPIAKPRPMITLRPEDKVQLQLMQRVQFSTCLYTPVEKKAHVIV